MITVLSLSNYSPLAIYWYPLYASHKLIRFICLLLNLPASAEITSQVWRSPVILAGPLRARA